MTPEPDAGRSIEQTYIDAIRDERLWKYLVLPDYSIRERAGYTASEVLWKVADVLHPLSDWVSRKGSDVRNWASDGTGA
jgi:hypothetical protein